MKMRFIATIATCMALTVFTANLNAQDKSTSKTKQVHTPEMMAQRRTDGLTKQLSLSDKQKEQVYNLYLKDAKKREAEAKSGQKGERTDIDGQMKKILSAEQYQKYTQMRADMKARHEQGAKDGSNNGKGKRTPNHGVGQGKGQGSDNGTKGEKKE